MLYPYEENMSHRPVGHAAHGSLEDGDLDFVVYYYSYIATSTTSFTTAATTRAMLYTYEENMPHRAIAHAAHGPIRKWSPTSMFYNETKETSSRKVKL